MSKCKCPNCGKQLETIEGKVKIAIQLRETKEEKRKIKIKGYEKAKQGLNKLKKSKP